MILSASIVINSKSNPKNFLQTVLFILIHHSLLLFDKTTESSILHNTFLDSWNYWGKNGEKHWSQKFRDCKGPFQSPINIETEKILHLPDLQLSFINYDQQLFSLKMTNNGHGIILEPTLRTYANGVECFIGGSAVNYDIYQFLQFHFHWRNSHSNGSEHAIDGKKFSMEIHFVHSNVQYQKLGFFNRIWAGDLKMVIGVFVNTMAQRIEEVHRSIHLNRPIQLTNLLPNDLEYFYRYYGSYTTPGCQETTAINNVAEKAKEKEEKEKDQEEDDEDEADEGEIGFYRKIQNLGSRQICAPLRASSISMMRSSKLTVIIVVCVGLFLVSIFFRYGIRMEKKTKLFFCDIRI
ncbi:hypothetical protein NH340_JMT07998 [Sarcoptes scabiei]|nr:hypothetical protein NH340_JMT07998 [Sarcoptes scabiei]